MAKYRVKKDSEIVDIELYEKGMEDGYKCNAINSFTFNICPNLCGMDKNLECKDCKFCEPYINTIGGGWRFIKLGEYIVVDQNDDKYTCHEEIVKKCFEKVED
jgi:hypothetical protein